MATILIFAMLAGILSVTAIVWLGYLVQNGFRFFFRLSQGRLSLLGRPFNNRSGLCFGQLLAIFTARILVIRQRGYPNGYPDDESNHHE